MNPSFVVTFTNEIRHVFGLGDFQRWEREGIRGRCFKGKILKGDVKGGQLRVPSLLTPSRICGMGWDFLRQIATTVEAFCPIARPAESDSSSAVNS